MLGTSNWSLRTTINSINPSSCPLAKHNKTTPRITVHGSPCHHFLAFLLKPSSCPSTRQVHAIKQKRFPCLSRIPHVATALGGANIEYNVPKTKGEREGQGVTRREEFFSFLAHRRANGIHPSTFCAFSLFISHRFSSSLLQGVWEGDESCRRTCTET